MPTLTVPLAQNPPFALLALALYHGAEIKWDFTSGEVGEISYDGITGVEKIRAKLEDGVPGREVSSPRKAH